jgi:enoyl-CoA hydratase
MTQDDIIFEETNGIGLITLNRPQALNALTTEICKNLDNQLITWQQDSQITAVIIKSSSEKAFCAGGDVRAIIEKGSEDNKDAYEFFATEYNLNARIFHYPKPYISLLNGITMGGGAGISVHGSHRIITERTLFAMPESAIGFIPDVGASYFLPKMPGALGLYLGLTGARLKGSDVLYTGIGTAFMHSDKLDGFLQTLIDEKISTDQDVDHIVARFAEDPVDAPLDEFRDLIDAAFSEKTIEDIIDHLDAIDHDWAKQTLAVLNKMSPLSLKLILEQMTFAKNMDFNECMIMEYRIACALSSYASDFYEGVRAVLIDKDHAPKWIPPILNDVTTSMVLAHFVTPPDGDISL